MLLECVVAGCGSPPQTRSEARVAPHEPVFEGQLVEYVPAGGVNWMLLGRPRSLAQNKALLQGLEPLLPPGRLDLFGKQTGIDLRTLNSAVIAGFDLGTLYLAETDADLTTASQAFSDRLVAGAEVKRPHPRLLRISGVVGRTPQSFLGFDGKLVAVGVGDTSTVRIVEAFARGKLKRTKRVFDGVALQSLRDFANAAPMAFVAAGPFEEKWMYGAAGLLAAASGIGISLTPLSGQVLEVRVMIDGAWDEASTAPVVRMRQAWEALAQSSTGRLFGLHEPEADPALSLREQRVGLNVKLRLSPIVNGLKAAVSADVWEMLDLAPTSTQRSGQLDREKQEPESAAPATRIDGASLPMLGCAPAALRQSGAVK
jgi:hypothetical protein